MTLSEKKNIFIHLFINSNDSFTHFMRHRDYNEENRQTGVSNPVRREMNTKNHTKINSILIQKSQEYER